MTSDHLHPGLGHLRSHGRTDLERFPINLNLASEQELAALPGIGVKRARELIGARPFGSWDAVAKLPGFDAGVIDELKRTGAILT